MPSTSKPRCSAMPAVEREDQLQASAGGNTHSRPAPRRRAKKGKSVDMALLRSVFEQYWPVLQRAIRYSGRDITRESVWAKVESRDTLFFPYEQSAALVCSIPKGDTKICQIWMGAGRMQDMRELHALITDWARETGHTEMEIVGRRGWLRAIPGYRERCIMMARPI